MTTIQIGSTPVEYLAYSNDGATTLTLVSPAHPLPISTTTETVSPLGYVQITDVSVAIGLSSIPASATHAIIQASGQSVRWRDDGTNPTTTVGMILNVGDTLYYNGTLSAIKFIQVTTSSVINVSYY